MMLIGNKILILADQQSLIHFEFQSRLNFYRNSLLNLRIVINHNFEHIEIFKT